MPRLPLLLILGSAVVTIPSLARAQSVRLGDPQAVTLVQRSVQAMATAVPSDSVASGTAAIIEGSSTQSGTIQILTRGTSQTTETIVFPNTQRSVTYSNGSALEQNGNQSSNPSLESVLTDQCPDFPLPFLLAALNNPDEQFMLIGSETLNGVNVEHIQFSNTFASNVHLQQFAPYTTRDIWFSSETSLPLRMAYTRRTGGGSAPSFPIEVTFDKYTSVDGVSYPFQITKSFNGTPWEAIVIQRVAFNTGLTDDQFHVQ